MAKRVIELIYFNHDMDAWAEELWEEMTDEQRVEMPNVAVKSLSSSTRIVAPSFRPNSMPSSHISSDSPPMNSATFSTPKTSAAPAASTRPFACSKSVNSANTENTTPAASSSTPGTALTTTTNNLD